MGLEEMKQQSTGENYIMKIFLPSIVRAIKWWIMRWVGRQQEFGNWEMNWP